MTMQGHINGVPIPVTVATVNERTFVYFRKKKTAAAVKKKRKRERKKSERDGWRWREGKCEAF